MKIKQYIFRLIQPSANDDIASKIFDFFIILLICCSIVSIFIMTFPISSECSRILNYIERFSLIVFTLEYLLRLWTADYLYPDAGKVRARIKYIFSGMAIIDLLAILPFFMPMFLPVNLIGLRAFRLVRLLRIFKLVRYSSALSSIVNVFRKKSQEILVSMFFVTILLIITSLLIYYAEHSAQPDKFTNAFSGLWWAVATITTVGYGDIYPITPMGKILGAIIALLGIGMVAVPTGILSSGFVEALQDTSPNATETPESAKEKTEPEEEKKYCPHCGKKL